MNIKMFFIAVVAVTTAGCSTAQIQAIEQTAGIGVLSSTADGFDGTRRVMLAPAPIAKAVSDSRLGWVADFGVGAQWVGTAPDNVILIFELSGEIKSIQGVSLNVDGGVYFYPTIAPTQFDLNAGSALLSSASIGYIELPLDIFYELISADHSTMRLQMRGGQYSDANFGPLSGRGGALTARHYMQNVFMPELESVRE